MNEPARRFCDTVDSMDPHREIHAGITAASLLTLLVCGALLPAGIAGARAQLDGEGLAIYGTVMRPGTRERVADARVLIETRRGRQVIVTTGPDGRFRLTGLEAGEYDVSPVLPDSDDERRRASVRTETLRLGRGEFPPDLVVWMPSRVRVSGRVSGPDGQPLPDMEVSLWRLGWSGERTLLMAMDTPWGPRTDGEGRYELYAPPGEYYVEARAVSADNYPRHYYPGVLYPEEAAPVVLRAGVDLIGIDITMGDTGLYRVRFSLDLPPLPGLTEPPSAYLAEDAVLLGALINPVGLGRIAVGRLWYGVPLERIGEHTWELGQLLGPGEYDLSLSCDAGALLRQLRLLGYDPDLYRQPFRIVNTRITVNPDDADGAGHIDLGTIPVPPRVTVAGRVLVRGLDRGSIDVAELRLTPGNVSVAADGTFIVEDNMPVRTRFGFAPRSIPEGWYVESIRSGALDVLREGLDLTRGRPDPVQIVIAEGTVRIQGTTRNDDGELIPGARVVLIPPLQERGWQTRFPTAVASSSGAYLLEEIPPGDYRVLALDPAGTVSPVPGPLAPDLYWEDPLFLREYEFRGERITLDPNARLTLEVEAIPYAP